jgi:hypothetical protein
MSTTPDLDHPRQRPIERRCHAPTQDRHSLARFLGQKGMVPTAGGVMRTAMSRRKAAARNDRIALVAVLGLMAAFLGMTVWLSH